MKHNLFCFLFLLLVDLFYYAPNTTASPIINGLPDYDHRFKYHVSIHMREGERNEFEHACSGNIISERYVLTAGHCFITIANGVIEEVVYPRGSTKIIAGTNRRNGPGIERDVIRVFIPSSFDSIDHPEGPYTEADIAVAELNADLGVSQHPDRVAIIRMEVLDPHSNVYVNRPATFCGFGQDVLVGSDPEDGYSTLNRFMDVRILGRNECPRFSSSICARSSDARRFRTACYGDSGTGLIYENEIVGVLSHGPPDCNTLDPIIFTRLHGFMGFIRETTNPHGDHSNIMILETRSQTRVRPSRPSTSRRVGHRMNSWPFGVRNNHARPR